MSAADTLTKGAAQAAPATTQATAPRQPERIAPNVSDLVSALCFAVAETNPVLAERTDAHLAHLLSLEAGQADSRAPEISATLEWYRDIVACADMLKGKAPAPAFVHSDPQPEVQAESNAASILWRVQSAALIKVLGRKRGERLVREMASLMAAEEAVSDVVPIRGAKGHKIVTEARQKAAQLFRAYLPSLIAAIPEKGARK